MMSIIYNSIHMLYLLILFTIIIQITISYHTCKFDYLSSRTIINRLHKCRQEKRISPKAITGIYNQMFKLFMTSESPEPQIQTLLTIRNEKVSEVSAIAFLQKWAALIIDELGIAMKANNYPKGVIITFKAAPGCHVDIFVVSDSSNQNLMIQSRVILKLGISNAVQSLIHLAAENLIESLSNQLQSLILDLPDESTKFIENKDVKDLKNEVTVNITDELDKDVIDSNEKYKPQQPKSLEDLKREIPNLSKFEIETIDEDDERVQEWMQRAKPLDVSNFQKIIDQNVKEAENVPIPTIQDMNNLWEPLTNHSQKVLFTWENKMTLKDQNASIQVIQSWASKYAGRGVGIEASEIDQGVSLSFAIMDDFLLELKLEEESMKTVLKSNRVNKHYEDTSAIEKVISNLEASIVKEMQGLQISFTTSTEEETMKTTHSDAIKSTSSTMRRSDGFVDDVEFLDYVKSPDDTILEVPLPDYISSNNEKKKTPSNHPLPQKLDNLKTTKRDPRVVQAANDLNLRLDMFDNHGLEDQALEELNQMVKNAQDMNNLDSSNAMLNAIQNISSSDISFNQGIEITQQLIEDMKTNGNISISTLYQYLNRSLESTSLYKDDLNKPVVKLPIDLQFDEKDRSNLVDVFKGPGEGKGGIGGMGTEYQQDQRVEVSKFFMHENEDNKYQQNQRVEVSKFFMHENEDNNQDKVESKFSFDKLQSKFPKNETSYELDSNRLQLLVNDLYKSPKEYHYQIIDSYRDLLLSNNIFYLLQEANEIEDDYEKRLLYNFIIQYVIKLQTELMELIQSESLKYLNLINDICMIAYEYQSKDGDNTLFLSQMDNLKPFFDTSFLSFLSYAIKEEEHLITTQFQRDYRVQPSKWLQILQLIYNVILNDFEMRYSRILEMIHLLLRFNQKELRSIILKKFVSITPAIDLQYLRVMLINIIEYFHEDKTRLNEVDNYFDLQDKLNQLRDDIDIYLSEDYINRKMKEFLDDASLQGVNVIVKHRNPLAEEAKVEDMNINTSTNKSLNERNTTDTSSFNQLPYSYK